MRKATLPISALKAASFFVNHRRRRRRAALAPFVVALLAVLALASGGHRSAVAADLGVARVASVVDGDTLVLDRDIDGRREVRLVGTQAPKLPLDRPHFEAWPLADQARDALALIVDGREVRLRAHGRAVDRHQRTLAHLYRDDGLWVQGEMLRQGMARVYTFADNRALAADMLAVEGTARAEGRGIWGHPFYAIRAADAALLREIDTFQIVEGRVQRTARVGSHVYLNFGADWRDDFTVSIAAKDLKTFEKAGIDPLRYEGRVVRVRGWIDSRNGPLLRVTHPEPIETVDTPDER